ncbi:hypothetical protein Skr01_28910 [Sphaerisporangium krabiense]|nr:hypothetical protein Skr01_28910 [Sphaerisporangium krabiense]
MVGNAAMATALGGPPGGAEPRWPGMLLAGQSLVGNKAVAVQAATASPKPAQAPPPRPKGKAPSAPGPEAGDLADAGRSTAERPDRSKEATGRRSPGADPKFQALKKDVSAKKRAVGSSHPPAAVEAGAAQAAAVPPADDREARGKAAHAEDMDAAQPKEFDKAAFIKAVEEAIAKRAPKNLDEADKFGDSGKAEEVKAEVQGEVGAGKDASAREIAQTTAQVPEPAPDAKKVVPLVPDRVPGRPGAPDPDQAVPDALPASATDMSDGPARVNRQMAEARVTERQLSFKNAREPSFDKAVRDKKAMEAHAETAPTRLRGTESRQIKQVRTAAAGTGAAAMASMHGTRMATGRRVGAGKQGAKGRDEDRRTQVTALLQKVFDQTKTDVEKILSDLDKAVDRQFTTGEKQARDRFTAEHTEGMRRYKDERYSGLAGKARWVRDLFADLPEEANRIYERAKANYLTAMRQVIAGIADTVERELHRAKKRIADGREDLRAAVDRLPKDLRAIGREAASEFAGRFEELADTVNDKGTELVDTLATRYTDAVKAVDAEIAAEKEKNKGLVSKAADAVAGAIETIMELKRLLLGVLAKAAQAVMLILADPIGFLGNLVRAVGAGLRQFMRNAGTHLKQGVLGWLLGTAGSAGLQIPARFDVRGILLMIAGLLGLSWSNIRARLTRKVPDQAVTAAEASVPLLVQVKRQGVAGMWQELRARVGDLKKDLIGRLVQYLTPTILIAGITWILSLLNPASAFVRAVKLIIDIVRFVVTQARQIIEFVNAVLDAVIAIARGGSGGVPAMVERALARSIPVLIGALAALLGIGGIAGRVRQIFQQLSRPVNRAVDAVIDKIAALVKKLWAKLKSALKKRKRPKPKPRPKRPGPAADHARPGRRRPDRRRADRRRPRRRPDRGKDPRRDRRSDKARQRALDAALREATRLLQAESATVESVRRGLPEIKRRHRLTSIRLVHESGDSYYIALTINPRKRTRPRKFSEKRFPYEIGKAEAPVRVIRLPAVIDTLRPIRIPMHRRDPMTGFVVNMAATPGEVRPDIAARYRVDAWKGKGADNLTAAQTAVVIGVNTFEHLEPAKDREAKAEVGNAVRRIKRPAKLLVAAFGFAWTPSWRHKTEGRPASMEEVRRAYMRLTSAEKAQAVARNERGWQPGQKLPYGIFHETVFLSSYTQRAVDILGKVNQQVYIVSQDPDTQVTIPSKLGFLHVYEEALRDADNNKILVIGGYHFEGFDWGPLAKSRTMQLTLLANRLDRAMKVAIGKVYPQILYPAEPNMLIKVWERDTSRKIKLLFQDPKLLATLRASQGEPWGVGAGEGRHIGEWLKRRHGVSVAHLPEAALTTSPLPESPTRGLTMTPEDVHLFVSEAGHPRFQARGDVPRYAVYAALMQSQTVLTAFRLASAFADTHPITSEMRARLQTEVFEHVEQVARMMADNPSLTPASPEIMRHLDDLDDAAGEVLADGQGDAAAAEVIEKAREVTRAMINAMTADEVREIWTRLSRLLDDILRDPPPSRGGPR